MKYTNKILFFVVCCFTFTNVFSQNDLLNLKAIIHNEQDINSEYLEFSPMFYKDGIVFISNRNPGLKFHRKDVSSKYKSEKKTTTSIFESKQAKDGVHDKPFIFAEDITTSYHEGPVTFSEDENTIYFTRNNFSNTVKGVSSDGLIKLKVYMADRKGNTWVNEREVPGINNDNYSTCNPSLSVDGNTLYFSSDRPGGKGGYDIWYCTKNGGVWSEPVNLEAINTSKIEAFPFIHKDGVLFYSSNGNHEGDRSDYDIYMVERTDDGNAWNKPVNLAPFNTGSDDFGFILSPDKERGYFSSNRSHDDAKGEDDIYSYTIEGFFDLDEKIATTCPVKVNVTDAESGDAISDAKVNYMGLEAQAVTRALTGDGNAIELTPIEDTDNEYKLKLVFDSEEMESVQTNGQGVVENLDMCKDHVLRVTKDGYIPKQVAYTPNEDDKDPVINVVLERVIEELNIDGAVVDKVTQKGISSPYVTIVNKETGETVDEFRADANGNFTFVADCGVTYVITVKAANYAPKSEELTLKKQDCWEKKKIELDFALASSLYGTRVPLNIYYDFNDSKIRTDAMEEFNRIVAVLQQYPYLGIELASHTDTRGTNAYNRNLSERRAAAAREYLITKGIAASRITAQGYGESRPKIDCKNNCTPLEHQTNRRTTATFINAASLNLNYNDNPPDVIDRK